MIGFFRILFFIVVIYLIIRWIRKIIEPAKNNFSQNQRGPEKPDGETTIRFNNKGEKIIDKNTGEYVDFEEVD